MKGLALTQIRGITGDQRRDRNLEDLRKCEQRAQGGIGRATRPGNPLFILLVGVARETRSVRDIFLTEPRAISRRTERGSEALGVRLPLRFDVVVPSGHLPSVVTGCAA